MAAESSSLTSDLQGKDHIFQNLSTPGPRGAYESRRVNGGLYVRVDMPGVPPDGVKLVKRGESRTVTFTGKDLKIWCKTSGRVYGAYVVLDRNPDEVDIEMRIVNGSVRMFFPACDGVLHFFARKNPVPRQPAGPVGAVVHVRYEKDCCHNKLFRYLEDNNVQGFDDFKTKGLHPDGCSCCSEDQNNKNSEKESHDSSMFASTHINPFMLDGMEGVVETRMGHGVIDQCLSIRIDMPGLGEKDNYTTVENKVTLRCIGEGSLEYPLDEGGRTYGVDVVFDCTCCKMADVKHQLKDGVLKVSILKHTLPSSLHCRVLFCKLGDYVYQLVSWVVAHLEGSRRRGDCESLLCSFLVVVVSLTLACLLMLAGKAWVMAAMGCWLVAGDEAAPLIDALYIFPDRLRLYC